MASASSLHKDLDSSKIHSLYKDADFEEAITKLESLLSSNARFARNDSIFIFKYLGVMYAAQERTREKGRYYMHQLLMVDPEAKIVDMYASNMIYQTFKTVQEEFFASHPLIAAHETIREKPFDGVPKGQSQRNSEIQPHRQTEPQTHSSTATDKRKSSSRYLWAGVGVVTAVAAGSIAVYYLANDSKTVIDENRP